MIVGISMGHDTCQILGTPLEKKPPDGYMWSGERLTKRQATSRPDQLWPKLWIKLGRNAELKEKHKLSPGNLENWCGA